MNPPAVSSPSEPTGALPAAQEPSGRVLSVDALRGFDMFWIIGAVPIVRALDQMSGSPFTRAISFQLQHSQWEGVRCFDIIFPLFLFLIGVSIVFSLDKAIVRDGMGAAMWRIVRRSIVLFLLGIFYTGGLSARWPDVQLAGVLHRIALCYLFAATIYLFFASGPKTMAGIAAALLIGYWALLTFVPFPDIRLEKTAVENVAKQARSNSSADIAAQVKERVSGVYEEGRNLTNYLDFRFLPGRKVQTYYINEGLLSTLPSIAICLFGAFAGRLLKNDGVRPSHKVAVLLAAGAAAVALGLLWSLQFPLIKRIWTSSFCLVASGTSAMLLAVFYQIVDGWRLQMWCRPFVWIGMNSITIYLAASLLSFNKLAERFAGGDVKAFLDAHVAKGFGSLVIALGGLALAVLLCWFLHRKKIFLRV